MSMSGLLAPTLVFLYLGASYWWTTASSRALHISKRASFYIANETVCVVDGVLYHDGELIPSDDPCESCKCRPPGFACVLRNCEVKPGCKAVRKEGECCPEYICGCEHNGIVYKDGDEIRNTESPCYTCFCRGSSIACALVDCYFRHDCEPTYVPGECCPRYDKCPPEQTSRPISVTSTTTDYYKQNEVQYANRVHTPVVYSEPEINLVGLHVESALGEGNVDIEPASKPDISQPTEHGADKPEQSKNPSHPTVTLSTDALVTSPERTEENTHRNTEVPGENQDGLFSNSTTTIQDHTIAPTAPPESYETTVGAQGTISKVDSQENDGVDDIIQENISETDEYAGTDSSRTASTQNEETITKLENISTGSIDEEVTTHGNLATVNVNPSSTQKPVVLITKGDTLSVTPQSIPVEDQIIVKTNPKDETQTSKLETKVTTSPNNKRQQEENTTEENENEKMVTTTSIYSTTVTAESNSAERIEDGVRGHLTVTKNVTVVESESPSNKTKSQSKTEESVTQTQYKVTDSPSSTASNHDIISSNLSSEDKELTSKNENVNNADVTYTTTLSKDIQLINVESKEETTTSTPYPVDSKLTNTDAHNQEVSIAQSTSSVFEIGLSKTTVESSAETVSEQNSTQENNNNGNQEITITSTTQIPDHNLVITTTELQDKTEIPKLIPSDFKNDQDGVSTSTASTDEMGTAQTTISETAQQSGTSEITTIYENEDETLDVETQGSLTKDQDKNADDSKVRVTSNSSDSSLGNKNHAEKEETSNVPLTKDINITSATSESKLQHPNRDILSTESLVTLSSDESTTTHATKQPFAKSDDDQFIIIKEIKELVVPLVDEPQKDAAEDNNKVKQTEDKVVEQSMPLDEGIVEPLIKHELKDAHSVPNNSTSSSVSQPKNKTQEKKTKPDVDKNNKDKVMFYIDTNNDELADILGFEESNSTEHNGHNNKFETPEATENIRNIANQTNELTNPNKTAIPASEHKETISTTCKMAPVMLEDVSTAQPESGNQTEQSQGNRNESLLPADIEPKSEDTQKVTESQNASENVSVIYYSLADVSNYTRENVSNSSAMGLQVNGEKSNKNDKYDDGSQNVTFIETLPLQQNISDKWNIVADQNNSLSETQFFAAEQSIMSILENQTSHSSTANISDPSFEDSSHNKTTSLRGENCTSTTNPATQTEDLTKLETSSNDVTFYSSNSSLENANETNETSTIFSPSNKSEEQTTDLPVTTKIDLSPIPILYSSIKNFKTQNETLENSSQPQTEKDNPESLISSSVAEEKSQTTVFTTQSSQSTTTLQPKSVIPHDFFSKTVMSHFFHDISHHESPNFFSAYLGSNLPYKKEYQGATRNLQRDQDVELQDKHLSVSNMLINKGTNTSQENSSHSDVNAVVKVLKEKPTFNITESGHNASTVSSLVPDVYEKLKDEQSTKTSNDSKVEDPDKSIHNQDNVSGTKSNMEATTKPQQDSTLDKEDEGTRTTEEQESVSLWEEGTTTKELLISSSS